MTFNKQSFADTLLRTAEVLGGFRDQLYEAERSTQYSSGIAGMERWFSDYNANLVKKRWPTDKEGIQNTLGQVEERDLEEDHRKAVSAYRDEVIKHITNKTARDQILRVLDQKEAINFTQARDLWYAHRGHELTRQNDDTIKSYFEGNLPKEAKKTAIALVIEASVVSGLRFADDGAKYISDMNDKIDMAWLMDGAVKAALNPGVDKDGNEVSPMDAISKVIESADGKFIANDPTRKLNVLTAALGLADKKRADQQRIDNEYDEKAMNVLVTSELKAYAPGVSLEGRKKILVGLLETGVPEAKYRDPELTRRDIDRFKSDIAEIDRQLAGGPDTVDKTMVYALEDQLRYAKTRLVRGMPTDVDLDILGIPKDTIITPTMLQNKAAPFARFLGDWFRTWYEKIGSDRTDAGGMAYQQIEDEIDRKIAALDKKSPSYVQDKANISSQGFKTLNAFSEFLINESDPDKIEKKLNNILVSTAIPEVTRRTDVIPTEGAIATLLDAYRQNPFELFYFNAVQGKYKSMADQLNANENKPKWDTILASTNLRIMGVTGGGTLKPITKVGESNPVVDDLGFPVFVFITNEPVMEFTSSGTVTTIKKREVNLRLQPKRASNGIDWNPNELVVAEFRQNTPGVWDWFPLDDQRTPSQRADYFSSKLDGISAKEKWIVELEKQRKARDTSSAPQVVNAVKSMTEEIEKQKKELERLRADYNIEKAKSERFIR